MKKGLKGILYHLCLGMVTAAALLYNAPSLSVKAAAMAPVPFFYTGEPVQYIVPVTGYYKLEVWGAEGSNNCTLNCAAPVHKDGLGGYAVGITHLTAGQSLWVVVGGSSNGYNGGGGSYNHGAYSYGGGATHIGTFASTLAAHGSADGVYIVAGGGGSRGCSDNYDSESLTAGAGGGFNGNIALSNYGGRGGTQNSGGAGGVGDGGTGQAGGFGQGGIGAGFAGNGGGGFFGGGGGGVAECEDDEGEDYNCGAGGGGGSSYLGSLEQSYTIAGVWSGNGKAVITPLDNTTVCEYPTSFSWVCPTTGYYALEAWGAQGGNGEIACDAAVGIGGNGGYAYGKAYLTEGTILQVTVGARGVSRYDGQAQDGQVKSVSGDIGGDTVIAALSGAVYVSGYGGGGGSDWCQAHDIGGGDEATNGYPGGAYADHTLVSDTVGAGGIRTGNGKVIITPLSVPEPGGGGSNYINTGLCYNSGNQAGIQQGNGAFNMQSVSLGFQDKLYLNDVAAPDVVAPKAVQTSGVNARTNEEAVRIEPAAGSGGTAVTVTWTEPEDGGSTYYHKAESYLTLTGAKLCTSNITKNTLTTGVTGYYYVVDNSATTTVTPSNGAYTSKSSPHVNITLSNTPRYLHVAAVDVAGNVGATSHIPVDTSGIRWPIYTKQIAVTDVINGVDRGTVYPKATNEYYVRADGEGAFHLSYESYMQGTARTDYQINYQAFDVQLASLGKSQRFTTKTPYTNPINVAGYLDVTRFKREVLGDTMLLDAMNTGAYRTNNAKQTLFWQVFSMHETLHGQTITVIPVAGAGHILGTVYSDWANDVTHAVRLTADGEAPVITGADVLEGMDYINHENGPVHLTLKATDALSGLREFKATVTNTDNGETATFSADAGGNIHINIADDNSLFYGDVTIELTATDNVGNTRVSSYGVTEFKLEAKVVNVNNPSVNVCKRGETAVLSVVTYGYCDRVVITMPAELEEGNESLQLVYNYAEPSYIQEEQLAIVVPLYCDDGTYEFTVKASKDGVELIEKPSLVTIDDDSVLDEIRVRIR